MTRRYLAPITAVVCVIAFICVAFAVDQGWTAAIDASIRETVHQYSSPALTEVVLAISFTGKVIFLLGLGSLVAVVFLVLRKFRWLRIFVLTMAVEMALEVALKLLFMRARQDPFFDLPSPESYSFPSGHALGSLCFYGILVWLVAEGLTPRVRFLLFGIAGSWILLIGIARIYLGMHYPSDVLGGFFLGGAWLTTVISVNTKKEKGGERRLRTLIS